MAMEEERLIFKYEIFNLNLLSWKSKDFFNYVLMVIKNKKIKNTRIIHYIIIMMIRRTYFIRTVLLFGNMS